MTKSSGAYPKVTAALIGNKHGLKHGHNPKGNPSPTYNSWVNMKRRCYEPSHQSYRLYGGRGIQVCQRWVNDFSAFLADMGERPTGMSIDRIDRDGNYEPGNCRWATASEQQRNKGPMPPGFNEKRIATRRANGAWNKRER